MKAQRREALMRARLAGIFPHTNPKDSWMYLVTEVAEVGDILLRIENQEHKRNHPIPAGELADRLIEELGDVMLMLSTLANHYDIDLDVACEASCHKLEAKHIFRLKEPYPEDVEIEDITSQLNMNPKSDL